MDSPGKRKKAGKKVNKKEVPKEEEFPDKKPPMKTASDVVSRLLWDESLPKRKFVVGYLDRFAGIVEKPFVLLDWSDPAVVDNYTLALPKHRIQYFKYRNRKVWDKNSRLDIIFGSTGSGVSIYDFMNQVDSKKAGFFDENIFAPECHVRYEDSSSDEDEKLPSFDTSDRPNFFIAARIVCPETVANLGKVVDYISEKDSIMAECCATRETFHLTVAILKLDTPAAINDAVHALEALKTANVPEVTLNLESLDVFKHRVLFACIPDDDDLKTLRDLVVKELSDRNLNMMDRHSFVPHVTLAKVSRPAFKARHSNYIDQYLYLQFEDDYFGSQIIDTLYLCEMTTQRREDGFYMCAAEVKLR